jgi:hypothetical protein
MKIVVTPLPKLLEQAEGRVNGDFYPQGQDLAHDRKRQTALAVIAGATPSAEFQQAAQIEGLTVETLASLIVAKPDALMARENARRQVIVRLRAAKNSAELDQILQDAGVRPRI